MFIVVRFLDYFFLFFFNDTATTEIYTLSLHDALPISLPIFPEITQKEQDYVIGHIILFLDRKSTRLNSSHSQISYAVFCLKKNPKCAAPPVPHHEMPLNTEIPNLKKEPHDSAPSANDDPVPAAHDVSSPSVLSYAIPYKNQNLLPISANNPHNHTPQDLLRSRTTTSAYPSNSAA